MSVKKPQDNERIPELVLLNRQRGVGLNMGWLKQFAAAALPRCAGYSDDGRFALRALEEVVVTVVSDKRIAKIHGDFMGIPTPTDVITFEHGEIVVSADTALSYCALCGHGLMAELGLYVVHGFLHLNGYLDGKAHERARMHAVQEVIWETCLRTHPEPSRPHSGGR
jgi:probable rRNA maturation factor